MDVISKPTEIAHYGLELKSKASDMKISPPKVNFHKFHESIGHPNNAITRNTAKAHGIDLEGPGDEPCASCVILKAQKSLFPNKRLYLKPNYLQNGFFSIFPVQNMQVWAEINFGS